MRQLETSQTNSSQFLIGRDHHGNWVVQDELGLYGGLFVNRTEALRYAMFENGHRPQAVIMVPGEFNLNLSGAARPVAANAIRHS